LAASDSYSGFLPRGHLGADIGVDVPDEGEHSQKPRAAKPLCSRQEGSYLPARPLCRTGKTFNAYLNALKIENACRLLETGLYSVSDAALQVGFSSYSKFSVEFKKYRNMSTTEYMKQKGKKSSPV